jgi:hypothetical protein
MQWIAWLDSVRTFLGRFAVDTGATRQYIGEELVMVNTENQRVWMGRATVEFTPDDRTARTGVATIVEPASLDVPTKMTVTEVEIWGGGIYNGLEGGIRFTGNVGRWLMGYFATEALEWASPHEQRDPEPGQDEE